MFAKSEKRSDYQKTRNSIVAMAVDYKHGYYVAPHKHRRAQLIFAASGVMTVSTAEGHWTVPATRAVWIPPWQIHEIRMTGTVRMRTLYFEPLAVSALPAACAVVVVTPLLRELILEAVRIPVDYAPGGRDERIMQLIVDEIRTLKQLPLQLRFPQDARARAVALLVAAELDSQRRLKEWAALGGVSPRTLERLFESELGISFGRWRQQARLQASLPLIAEGRPVLETALRLGYESPSAFTYAFRRAFGMTPSRWAASLDGADG